MSHVVEEYFAALARHDADAMAELWAPDGVDHIAGQGDAVGPAGVREYFSALFTAFPDLALEVRSTVDQGDCTAVHWTATGTMLGSLWGVAPTGARVELEGIDVLRVRDAKIVRNDAVPDALSVARQIGLLPAGGSAAERRLFGAFNAGTRVARRAAAERELERVADGVWLLRGGVPRRMNVYLLEDAGGGVTLFDAGHAPGMIVLFREQDRLALTSDAFYVVDPETGRAQPPGPPPTAFNQDTEQARASLRKLAALEPSAAWPGHLDPLTGDVRAQLERAAAA